MKTPSLFAIPGHWRVTLLARVPFVLVGLVILFWLSNHFTAGWVVSLERTAYDWRLRLWNDIVPAPEIAIIDLDEASLNALGEWPWPRARVARLVETLMETYQPALIAMDIVFPAADDKSPARLLTNLTDHPDPAVRDWLAQAPLALRAARGDQRLAEAWRRGRVVAGFMLFNQPATALVSRGELPAPVFRIRDFHGVATTFPEANSYLGNLPILTHAASGIGNFVATSDADGVIRRVALLYAYQGGLYQSLGLAVARAYLDNQTLEVNVVSQAKGYAGLEGVVLDGLQIPVDGGGQTLVPYPAQHLRFPRFSAGDVLARRVDPAQLRNKILFLGASAPSLNDLRNTPLHQNYPGVEIHAAVTSGILERHMLHRPKYADGAAWFFLVVGGGLLLILPWLPPWMGAGVSLLPLAALLATNYYYWGQGLVLPLSPPLVAMVVLPVLWLGWKSLWEPWFRPRLNTALQNHLAPRRWGRANLRGLRHGEEQTATVLALQWPSAEAKLPPAARQQRYTATLETLVPAISRHHGMVGGISDHGLLAYWNLPVPRPDHAAQALNMAWEWSQHHPDGFIALHCGPLQAGIVSHALGHAWWLAGDDFARRLAARAERFAVPLVASETVVALNPDWIYRELDRLSEARYYQVLAPRDRFAPEDSTELDEYHEALEAYQQGAWSRAESLFAALCHNYPEDPLYPVYRERCQRRIAENESG